MRDASFFLALAGLAMSVAGLAGLVSAFRRTERGWTAVELWRLRQIARLSFICVFLALAPFPVFALFGDEAIAIRFASAAILAFYLSEIVLARMDRVNWPGRTWITMAAVPTLVFASISVVNLFAALTGLLELAILLLLAEPIGLFLKALQSFEPLLDQ